MGAAGMRGEYAPQVYEFTLDTNRIAGTLAALRCFQVFERLFGSRYLRYQICFCVFR